MNLVVHLRSIILCVARQKIPRQKIPIPKDTEPKDTAKNYRIASKDTDAFQKSLSVKF